MSLLTSKGIQTYDFFLTPALFVSVLPWCRWRGGLGSECPLDSGLGKGVRCCSITRSCPRGSSGVDGGQSPPLFPKYFLKVKWGRGSR